MPSPTEQHILTDACCRRKPDTYWTGLTHRDQEGAGVHRWYESRTVAELGFSNWANGEPKQLWNLDKDCVAVASGEFFLRRQTSYIA